MEGKDCMFLSYTFVAFIMFCMVLLPIMLVFDLLQVATLLNQSIRF